MVCDILDFKCVIVNELIGSVALTIILAAILYFVIAAKMKLGFETTLVLFVPIILAFSMVVFGLSAVYIFITLLAGLLVAFIILRLIGNR